MYSIHDIVLFINLVLILVRKKLFEKEANGICFSIAGSMYPVRPATIRLCELGIHLGSSTSQQKTPKFKVVQQLMSPSLIYSKN